MAITLGLVTLGTKDFVAYGWTYCAGCDAKIAPTATYCTIACATRGGAN